MDYDLDRINQERRTRRLQPLTRAQAAGISGSRRVTHPSTSNDDMMTYLIMYSVISADSSPARAEPEPVVDSTPTPAYEPPKYEPPAYDPPASAPSSSDSSSSSDSGSSSSSDSGSSGSGSSE